MSRKVQITKLALSVLGVGFVATIAAYGISGQEFPDNMFSTFALAVGGLGGGYVAGNWATHREQRMEKTNQAEEQTNG